MNRERDAATSAALRARRGDADAATAFIRATQADVWRLCAQLGSRADADDLTQETYTRAFASLHRFAGRASVRTWLFTIARYVCADAIRAATRRRAVERTTAAPEDRLDMQLSTDPAESATVRQMVAALDPQRREAFVLTQMIGLSYAEAAQVCGCPVGTIRSRVFRARAELVESFQPEHSGRPTLRAGAQRVSR
jgi:RNA polymerase sigma-70 factor (ECF subfamily)